MGMSKKDLSRHKMNVRIRLEELEKKSRNDPLKRDTALWEEIEQLKRKIAEQ